MFTYEELYFKNSNGSIQFAIEDRALSYYVRYGYPPTVAFICPENLYRLIRSIAPSTYPSPINGYQDLVLMTRVGKIHLISKTAVKDFLLVGDAQSFDMLEHIGIPPELWSDQARATVDAIFEKEVLS